jgi:hypothetical protein
VASLNDLIFAFNRGLVSPLGQARQDLKRLALSADIFTNWMPRLLGSMMLRPGLGYTGSGTNGNAKAKMIPFVFATDDLATFEVTDSVVRFRVPADGDPTGPPDELVVRPAVATTITNGQPFAGDLSGWTNADDPGAISSPTTISGVPAMALLGTGFNSAKRYQQVMVAPGDQNVEHAVRIVVAQETATIRIGSGLGLDDYVNERPIGAGTHSLTLTPTGNFFVQLQNGSETVAVVLSVAIEGAGPLELPTPWPLAALSLLRWDQTGDIVYIAANGYEPQKIQRTLGSSNTHSWSILSYRPMDGPFRTENFGPITLAASALTGVITLTASAPVFGQGHVGALFRLASVGQDVQVAAAGTNQFSPPIKVTGVGSDRSFLITVAGTFNATVQLQRSIGTPGDWADVSGESFTSPAGPTSFNDTLDNQVIYYRIGIEGTYTSGTANCQLQFTLGTITGICRVTAVTDSTHATANVLTQLNNTGVLTGMGSLAATSQWWEGAWSPLRGYPTSVVGHEGRLWWSGRGQIWGSVSDSFESYDDTVVGDSGPIIRTVGFGPVDISNWMLSLQRLIIGTQGAEKSVRSSSFDSPITPTDFVIKDAATQGSSSVGPVKIDYNGVFVQKSGLRVFQLTYSPNYFMLDYTAADLTRYVPDIALAELGVPLSATGVAALAVQRMPDTRVHAILNDGTARVLVLDPSEDEICWVKVASPSAGGVIEDVVVLPGPIEDYVYYVVKRTVNGSTVRYLERWAREDECWGLTVNKVADAFVTGTQVASTTITGLGHLEGASVVCWADGIDQGGPYTVTGGQITLPVAVASYVVGLGYTAQFRSTPLTQGAQMGTAFLQRKRIARIGFMLANTHFQGLEYGSDFGNLNSLPLVVDGVETPANTVWNELNDDSDAWDGGWSTDERICLQASAPRPVTIKAAVFALETRERT